jgi:hypothetical protein
MSLIGRLLNTALKGGKGLIKAGRGSVDDVLRNTPLGGAPVRQSVGTIDSVRPMTGRITGTPITGTSPAAMNNNAGILQSAPYVPVPLRGPSLSTPSRVNGFAGRAPSGFSPLGQAPRNSPPVPRAAQGGGSNPIVGPRTARPSLRTPPKVNARNASAVALGAGGLAAANYAPAGSIEDRINQVGPAIDRFVSNLNFPGQQALSDYGREQEKRGFASLLDFSGGLLGPVAGRLIPNSAPTDPLAMRERYGGSGDMDAGSGEKAGPPLPTAASEQKTGAWTINGWDPNAKRPTSQPPTSQPPTSQPPTSDTDRFVRHVVQHRCRDDHRVAG